MRMILRFRPISWMFRRNWYSFYRWTHPQDYGNEIYKLFDFGSITIGYVKKASK